MESNFTYPMKLEEYAHLSSHNLSLFKKISKKSTIPLPAGGSLKSGLNMAATCLRKRTNRLPRLLWIVGLKNSSHFSRAFKEHYGMPPKEVRKASEKKL